MKKLLLIIAAGLLLVALPQRGLAASDEAPAIEAAEAFLTLLDNGETEAAFAATTELNRNLWGADFWVGSIGAQRAGYGPLVNRAIKVVVPRTTIPKHPDGDYFRILFETSFAHKAHTTEVVAVLLEADGSWRVADYICN